VQATGGGGGEAEDGVVVRSSVDMCDVWGPTSSEPAHIQPSHAPIHAASVHTSIHPPIPTFCPSTRLSIRPSCVAFANFLIWHTSGPKRLHMSTLPTSTYLPNLEGASYRARSNQPPSNHAFRTLHRIATPCMPDLCRIWRRRRTQAARAVFTQQWRWRRVWPLARRSRWCASWRRTRRPARRWRQALHR